MLAADTRTIIVCR